MTSPAGSTRHFTPLEASLAALLALVCAALAYWATSSYAGGTRAIDVIAAGTALVGVGLVARGVMTRPDTRWRTVDIVVAAALAVASGVVFWAWGHLWSALTPAFTWFPPALAVIYGMWFLPAALVPLIVRKPGAALFAEVVGAVLEYLLADQFGAAVLVYGVAQGLLAEAVWAAFGYRRWSLPPALLAGAAAGLAGALLDITWTYTSWSGAWKTTYVLIVVASGAVLTGWLSWVLVRALAPTGALSAFAAGRSRELV
jgi:energy-coupling factor transport system substrate-specific component